MSSEIALGVATFPPESDTPSEFDRVMAIAGDGPSPSQDSMPALVDPAADHVDESVALRRADVDEKHQRVIKFLDAAGYHAALIGRADSLAWFTSGGELGQTPFSERGAVHIYINHTCRAVFCDNVQSPRIFEEELAGLGFQLKERPWHGPSTQALVDVGRGKRIASDGFCPNIGFADERERLASLRFPLTKLERQRLRELGRTLTLSLEATCRNFEGGETEADIAGHLAHRLLREGVTPVDLRVAGDDRLGRYRQPTFKAAAIERNATISAIGRRHGLCASATRTVSLGPIDASLRKDHELAAMVDATCIFFSRPGESVGGVCRRARRIYEKFAHPDEWMLGYQGFVIAYDPREAALAPESQIALRHGLPVAWCPSVGAARSEDTVVVDERGFDVVTEAQRWPKLEILVKGYPLMRPGILER